MYLYFLLPYPYLGILSFTVPHSCIVPVPRSRTPIPYPFQCYLVCELSHIIHECIRKMAYFSILLV
ncbi:hypothetical protein HanRHA438_Chr15g0727341 [Helianthus annuus]|nr:hypothetical protein HanIR_Chr15g0777941 [Helianthus annuus]KAJ0846651.1 hypothetical protein HanRHA438_Chr15g0727341 [Helianthus annuus]